MPFRRLPNSDRKRFRALQLCKTRADAVAAAERPFSLSTFNRLTAGFALFDAALQERGKALSAQAAATRATRAAQDLSRQVSTHFLRALNQGIQRGNFTASARAFYHLDVSNGSVPVFKTEPEILLWGRRLVAGEAERVAAGGAPIPFPSIAEVKSAVDDFAAKQLAQGKLSEAMAEKEMALAALRPEMDELIRDLWDEIEFAFRRRPAPALRKLARDWGVFYDRRPGEAAEPELEEAA